MCNPRTTRHTFGAALLGLVATLATATTATARPVTAYVVNYADDTVTPIDLSTGTPGAPVPVGDGPTGIAITPDGRTAWVANYGNVIGDPVHGPYPSSTSIDTVTDKAGPTIRVPDPYATFSPPAPSTSRPTARSCT